MGAQRFVNAVPAHEVQMHIDQQYAEGYEVQQLDYVNFMVSILFRPQYELATAELMSTEKSEHFDGCPTPTGPPEDCDYCNERSRTMAGE